MFEKHCGSISLKLFKPFIKQLNRRNLVSLKIEFPFVIRLPKNSNLYILCVQQINCFRQFKHFEENPFRHLFDFAVGRV
jgi:hypothetical protein